MADERKTTDHNEIKDFAMNRNIKPAAVKTTDSDGGQEMIRLMQPDSPHSKNENLKEITWDEWLDDFEKNKLALVYDNESNFNKLVNR